MSQLAKSAVNGSSIKNLIIFIIGAVGLFFAGLILFVAWFLMSLSGGTDQSSDTGIIGGGIGGTASVSPAVSRWEPLVRKYAAENGIEQHTAVILALIQQESSGVHLDVMQSSESIGLPPGTITDPEYSIKIGVKYFSGVLKDSKGDIKLALQSYNFGGGFIPYALERGGYSKEVASSFSSMMAAKMGWSRYGDINYVDNVLRYLSSGAGEVLASGFVRPITGGIITSNFGARFDPFTGVLTTHYGVDISCERGQAIFAAKEGTVERAGWQDPSNYKVGYGQRIYINSGGNVTTVYGHLSQINVKPGQTVKQGQQIGGCGTTGASTGDHLHFEVVINGEKRDPLPYIQ